jgi:hypothetical protein
MAANSGESRVTGKLADKIIGWAKVEAGLDGTLGEDVHVSDARVTNVWKDHYRVNLYQKYLPPTNSLVPDYRIITSYLVECGEDGVIWNKTRRPSSAYSD